MDLRRLLGLALGAVALALVVWGLLAAKVLRVDFPAVTPAPPAEPRPVTISIDNNGGVHVRDGAPSTVEPPAPQKPGPPQSRREP